MSKRIREMIGLAWPITLSFLSYHIMGIIDVLMVGQLGKESVAAVGLGLTFFWLTVMPCEGFFDSALILFSRAVGQNRSAEFKNYLFYEIVACFGVSLLCLALYLPVSWAMRFATDSELVLEQARMYMLINVVSLPAYFASWIMGRFLIAIKKNRVTALYSNIAVVLNIVLNYLLIFGKFGFPALGVAGAALATVLARIVFMLLMMRYSWREAKNIFSPADKIDRDWIYLKKIIALGSPLAQTNLIEVAGWTVFVAWIGRLGTVPLASHEIALKIKDFLLIPASSIASVTTSLVGEAVGKRDQIEAKKIAYTAAGLTVGLMGGYGIILLVFPKFLVGLFINDAEVFETGATLLRIMALYQVMDAIFITGRAALTAVEDVRFVRSWTLIGGWLVMLPTVYCFSRFLNWGVYGAWAGFTTFVALCGVVFAVRFVRGDWVGQGQ
ncbi:MAG TPA: MATE family efflux transporter [bacterium]